ncbi:MAG TPA: hypothetical protein VFW66_04015 [Gemmatimonadales bacterium]|nr:hypothetical protein [Gemmatimonadales bacterium]
MQKHLAIVIALAAGILAGLAPLAKARWRRRHCLPSALPPEQ